MNKKVIFGIVIIIIILLGAILFSYQRVTETEEKAEVPEGPHIVVKPANYDFGRVKFGDVPEYTFTVENIGDQDLEIKGVTTSCACTKGEMTVSNIAPGGQADLIVSFDPAVHGDDTDLGQLTRTVYISTNDPHQEEIEAKIYADVYK